MILGLVVFGIVGLIPELLLLGHVDSFWQWAPIAALGAGLVAAGAVALRPAPATLRTFQAMMALFVVLGAVGFGLHFRGNLELEREIDPSARGARLWYGALSGATPALAPGALAQLGLLGLVYAWRHPAWSGQHRPTPPNRTTSLSEDPP